MAKRQQVRQPHDPSPTPSHAAPAPNAPHMHPNQRAVVGDRVMLNGSGYHMGDMAVPSYQWAMTGPDGEEVSLTHADKVSPSFVPEEVGDYRVTLVTADGPVTVIVHVTQKA